MWESTLVTQRSSPQKMPDEEQGGVPVRVRTHLKRLIIALGVMGFRHLETVGLSVELRPIASPAVTEHPTHGGGCAIVEVACWNGTRPQRAKIRMALLNARSLANKTFLLRDFFAIPDLDFLRLTATRLHAGESAHFSELLPPSCSVCRSLQTSVLE